MELVNQAEYARLRGVSRKTATAWKAKGFLVFSDGLVDVAATDARLKKYRRAGLPTVTHGAKGNKALSGNKHSGELTVTYLAAEQMLVGLDWQQEFDWSSVAQEQRAIQAAQVVGLVAVKSDRPVGDGQWGGFQIRDPRIEKAGRLQDAIIDGFGYELSAESVIQFCREELLPFEGDDEGAAVTIYRPHLLSILTFPIWQGQQQLEGDFDE